MTEPEGRREAGPVKIAQIAETAGVSLPTVSKVLHGRPGVSEQTRARVEEVIERYGYRKPQPKGSDALELVFHELAGMQAVEVIRGVEQVARKHRFSVVVSDCGPGPGSGDAATTVNDLIARRSRAVLAVARLDEPQRELLASRGIPFLVLDPATELPDDVPFVGATDWRGGQLATQHLVKLGHRRIAVISEPDLLPCRARLAGFHFAMQAAGLAVEPDLVIDAPLTREDGYSAALGLLARADRPTAIFASSDLQALGAYRAAREAGLRIPEDLSVVGFDDLPVAALVDPPLTTVHRPLAEMAAAAAEMALSLGRGEEQAQTGVEMATTLAVRESTAPPAAAGN